MEGSVGVLRCVFCTVIFAVAMIHVFSAPCKKDVCATTKCVEVNQTNCDFILENATLCGCCAICINYTKKDSYCYKMRVEDVGISGRHCGPQLVCEKNSCTRKSTTCLDKLTDYEEEQASEKGYLQIAKTKPHCDDNGEFFRKQCRPGSWCYCVDQNGLRIFGESNDHENDDVGCACSRKFHDTKALISNMLLDAEQFHFTYLDYFFRCLPNGDFDLMQCVDDECFCINKDLEMDSNRILARVNFSDLQCYDPSYHSEILVRKCEQELQNAKVYYDREINQNKVLVGLDVPNCDLDGTYAPKQCRGNECYCVDKEGNKLENYAAPRHSKAAKEMKCECARENLFRKKYSLTGNQVICDSMGDYRSRQCLGGTCYCVNKDDGEQIGLEFDRLGSNQKCP